MNEELLQLLTNYLNQGNSVGNSFGFMDMQNSAVAPNRGFLAQNGGLFGQYQAPLPFMENGGGVPKAFLGKLFKEVGKGVKRFVKQPLKTFGQAAGQAGKGVADWGLGILGMPDVIQDSWVDRSKFLNTANNVIGQVGRTAANIALPGSGTAIGMIGGGINNAVVNGRGNAGGAAPGMGGMFGDMMSQYGVQESGYTPWGSGVFGRQPLMFKNGGIVDVLPEELTGIQTEKYKNVSEQIVHPDGKITKSNADRAHEKMEDDFITDIVEVGSYVASARPDMAITRKSLEDVILGYKTFPYDEDQQGKPPEMITAASILPDGKNKILPAEYAQTIKNKYAVVDQDNPFDKATDALNMAGRIPYLQALASLGEENRIAEEGNEFRLGGPVGDPPGEVDEAEAAKALAFEVAYGNSPIFRQRVAGLPGYNPAAYSANVAGTQYDVVPTASRLREDGIVDLNPNQAAKAGLTASQLFSHELSHVNNELIEQYPQVFDQIYDRMSFEKTRLFNPLEVKMIYEANPESPKAKLDAIQARQEEVKAKQDAAMRGGKGVSGLTTNEKNFGVSHSYKPDEIRADIQSLRFMMKEAGIYDDTKATPQLDADGNITNITAEDLKKLEAYLKEKSGARGSNKSLDRVMEVLGRENLLYLMNNLAALDSPGQDFSGYAKFGGHFKKGGWVKKYPDGGTTLGNIAGVAGQLAPFIQSLLGGPSSGNVVTDAMLMGSFPLASYGDVRRIGAQRSTLDNALGNLDGLTSDLSSLNAQGMGVGVLSNLAQETELPRLQQDFSRLQNFDTSTPQSFIQQAATPTIDVNSAIQRLGPRAGAALAANVNAQGMGARNQVAMDAFGRQRGMDYGIANTVTQGLNQQSIYNNQMGQQEIAARNNVLGNVGSQIQSGLANQGNILSDTFTTGTNLDLQRANLAGGEASAIAQNMFNLGSLQQTLAAQQAAQRAAVGGGQAPFDLMSLFQNTGVQPTMPSSGLTSTEPGSMYSPEMFTSFAQAMGRMWGG